MKSVTMILIQKNILILNKNKIKTFVQIFLSSFLLILLCFLKVLRKTKTVKFINQSFNLTNFTKKTSQYYLNEFISGNLENL